MKKIIIALSVLIFTVLLVILFGGKLQKAPSHVNEFCQFNSDCETPVEYLIQSNCPFSSLCINSGCRVVCPLDYHDQNPAINASYGYECKRDSDCDCSTRGNKTLECRCVDNYCFSIEK